MIIIDPKDLKPGRRVRRIRPLEGVIKDVNGSLVTIAVEGDPGGEPCRYVRADSFADTWEIVRPPVPTGLGAVVQARVKGDGAKVKTLVRSDLSYHPWRPIYGGCWVSDAELDIVEVLSPGVEVEP